MLLPTGKMKGLERFDEVGKGKECLTPTKRALEGEREMRWGAKQSARNAAGEVIPIGGLSTEHKASSCYHLPANVPNTPGAGIQPVVSPI